MRIVKTLLIGLVILWGVLALLVRATTPLLADYRAELAARAGDALGAPVSIGALKARWYGLGPVLELHDVTVGAAPEAIHARRIAVDLDVTDLLHGTLVGALRVTAEGLELTAVREASGRFHLEGLGVSEREPTAAAALPVPRHLRLIDTRVIWIDRLHARSPLPLDDINILFDRDGADVSLRANLETGAGSAQLSARLRGFLGGTEWEGDSYLRVDNLDVARLLDGYLPVHYGVTSSLLDLQTWTRWRDARPVHNQGRVTLRDIALHPSGGAPYELALLAANFSIERSAQQLTLGLDGLQLATPAGRWPLSGAALRIDTPPDAAQRIQLAADYLRIEDIAALARVRLPLADVDTALAAIQPAGELRNLRVDMRHGDDGLRWNAAGDFAAVSGRPWKRIPGVDAISGHFVGNQAHGVLTLDSRDSVVTFNGLFRDPLVLPRIAGRVDVEFVDDGWTLSSRRLQVDAAHLRTLTRLALRRHADGGLFIDLQSDFRDGDAMFAGRYYPVGTMNEPLVRWLDRAIQSGRVARGSALVYGPLDDYAWEQTRTGSFQVVFDTEDVHLDYTEGWPALTELDARVKFHGKQVDIHASAGRLYDSDVRHVHARIASLEPLTPIRIRGQVDGPLQNTLRVLGEPALRPRFGEFADALRGAGDSTLALDFAIPLGKRGTYTLDGRLGFAGNRLALPGHDFALRDIEGELGFTLDGLQASGIRARALGAPVRVDVAALADGTTRVRSRGRFGATAIAAQLDDLPLDAVRGAADFVVDALIPPRSSAAQRSSRLAVSSDLRGMAVELPAPLGKVADAERRLSVDIPLGARSAAGKLRYGTDLAARFSADGQRVDVAFADQLPKIGAERGIRISGQLAELDIAAWQAVIEGLPQSGSDATPPLRADLTIDRLRYGDVQIDDLELALQRSTESLRGELRSATLSGRFDAPRGTARAPVRVDLERLAIRLPDDDSAPGPPPDARSGPDPVDLPGLQLDVADLRVNDARLGRLRLAAEARPNGLELTRLSLRDGQAEIDAGGSWTRADGGFSSRVEGRISTADLGKLLVDLGYSRQFEDAAGNGAFRFEWPGSPAQAHRATLSGELDIEINDGRLVELDPGVTRVVGLMNLTALTRRLRLDFSDFYKKGYSFYKIAGRFGFADGVAKTDDVAMLGPTGRVDIRGSTDLQNRTIDQQVMVTPNLDATLPIASTIAGGPVAGIAVLVAQKALTKQVDAINRFDYSISGPWSNPEVTQLDSSGTLSKLLKPFRGGGKRGQGNDQDDDVPQSDAPEPAPKGTSPAPQTATGSASGTQDDDGESDADAPRRGPLDRLLGILKKGQPTDLDTLGE